MFLSLFKISWGYNNLWFSLNWKWYYMSVKFVVVLISWIYSFHEIYDIKSSTKIFAFTVYVIKLIHAPRINLASVYADPFENFNGVKQGEPLSPLSFLFLFFMGKFREHILVTLFLSKTNGFPWELKYLLLDWIKIV